MVSRGVPDDQIAPALSSLLINTPPAEFTAGQERVCSFTKVLAVHDLVFYIDSHYYIALVTECPR